jgi:tripartite-type tricarboxylate transporter receptor subunit TctC
MRKLILAVAMLLSNSAWAQNITAVVTGPAGSATDTFARAIMKRSRLNKNSVSFYWTHGQSFRN